MSISVKHEDDRVEFSIDGEHVGFMDYSYAYLDDIASEYEESVEDFNPNALRCFDPLKPIVNIEYFYIERGFRGQHLGKPLFNAGLKEISNERNCRQFILRAFPDDKVDQQKLLEIYESSGFVIAQETESDGYIMTKCE